MHVLFYDNETFIDAWKRTLISSDQLRFELQAIEIPFIFSSALAATVLRAEELRKLSSIVLATS